VTPITQIAAPTRKVTLPMAGTHTAPGPAPADSGGTAVHQSATTDPRYEALARTPEFAELRRRYRGFVFPATLAFIVWYSLYVVLSMWAHDFMSHELVGNINVALVFGILQFVTTFGLAWLYARYSNTHLDPLARQLDEQYKKES